MESELPADLVDLTPGKSYANHSSAVYSTTLSRKVVFSSPSPTSLCKMLFLFIVCFIHPATAKISPPRFQGLPTIDEMTAGVGVTATHSLVQTEDGYMLMMHRLGNNTGPPVLIQHGLLIAADIWLLRGNRTDLPYMLLNEGYDVYLGNFRGNSYSRYHTRMKPSQVRFWDFSFHEYGYYDIPAMIDRILETRGLDQLFFIGHSLGATVFYVMASTRPEYNAKIRAAALLAPVAYLPDRTELSITAFRFGLAYSRYFWSRFNLATLGEVYPRTSSMIKAISQTCDYRRPTVDYCLDILGIVFGEHRTNFDRKLVGYYMSFTPAGTSLKTIQHLSQVLKTEEFGYLDRGPKQNLILYNSTKAPQYPLERITAPVGLFWSWNDNFVTERTITKVKSRLPNVVYDKPLSDPKFTHADGLYGLNAKEVMYDQVIALLNKFR